MTTADKSMPTKGNGEMNTEKDMNMEQTISEYFGIWRDCGKHVDITNEEALELYARDPEYFASEVEAQ